MAVICLQEQKERKETEGEENGAEVVLERMEQRRERGAVSRRTREAKCL